MTTDVAVLAVSTSRATRCFLLVLTAQFAVSASAMAQSPQAAANQPALPDQEKEIALALSACPASVANKAAVYVLGKSG